MAGAPLRDAAILVDEGRIAAVGPDSSVPVPDEARRVHLGEAILLPGLINTHTHLELTGLDAGRPDDDFTVWIRRIRTLKEARTAEEYRAAAEQGLRDCWAGGVTTVAETGDSGAVLRALAELGGSGIVYQEVFGPHPVQAEESLDGLRRKVAGLRPCARDRVRIGVSPHAPYTVSGILYRAVALWARSEGLPLAVHLAESRAETELVATGTGAFAEAWTKRGIPVPEQTAGRPDGRTAGGFHSPVRYLDSLRVLGPDTLCIHTVQLDAKDVKVLASRGVAIAHCPVSNRRHGHGDAPLDALRRAGLRIGVGTDSVASVGRLDLLAEARAARGLAGLSAGEALELCTLGAARALGLESEVGSLSPGKWADLAAVAPGPGAGDPEEGALAATSGDVVLTVVGGRIVHDRLIRGRGLW